MASSSSIDGLVSGLDTTSIISQLMDVERAPQDNLKTRRDSVQAGLDALKSLETKLAAVGTAAGALTTSAKWQLRTASSSDTDVATVATSTGAVLGSFSFVVDRLAKAHGLATGNAVAGLSTVVASGGTLNFTVGGKAKTVSVGTGTLSEVVDAINNGAIGVRAAAVNTGSGYKLQLTATTTGDASTFTLDAGLDASAGGTVITTQGQSARLLIGDGPGAYYVTSQTNTFTGVAPGVTITAKTASVNPVTVSVESDSAGLANNLQAMVDAVNGALSEIKTRTAYDPTSKKAASLVGNPAVRQAQNALLSALTTAVGQSSIGSPGLVGVALDKNGNATFDRQKFLDAYAKDPDAVQRLFVQGSSTTGSVTFVSAGDRTVAGTSTVHVTTPATAASVTGLGGIWPMASPATVKVRIGSIEASYDVGPTDSAADAAHGLQAALDSAGLNLAVAVDGGTGGLTVTNRQYGSSAKFDIAWDGTTFTTQAGTDVAGTIGGVAAVGTGNVLSVPITDPQRGGLSVAVTAGATGDVGTLSYEPGLAQRLSSAIALATDAKSGYVTGEEDTKQSNIDLLTKSIDAYDDRLATKQAALKTQYAALEVALGKLKDQSNWLTGQLAGLAANNSKN